MCCPKPASIDISIKPKNELAPIFHVTGVLAKVGVTPARMAFIKKTKKLRVGQDGKNVSCWWEYKLVQSLWKQYEGSL